MKSMEIFSHNWTDAERDKAYAKLEELGYVADKEHGTYGCNGLVSISVYDDGTYCGDDVLLMIDPDDLTPTFDELMQMKKEDVI